jgi:hypothetical protein
VPRAKKASSPQVPVMPTTALLASAHRYVGKVPRIYAPSKDWQARAYHHYGTIGEARFAARYFGHALSRAVLFVEGADGARKDSGPAYQTLSDLFGGPDGQAEMLEQVGVHLTVAGEVYLVGRAVNAVDVWEAISVMEINSNAGGWTIQSGESGIWEELEDEAVVLRIWIPRPDKRWEADSPFRSMLPVLDEIERITRMIHSQTISSLTGNGLLLMPDSMTFPPPPEQNGEQVEVVNQAESFMLVLGEMMSEALKGDGSASEQVPGVVVGPAEALEQIRHLTFWTNLDENAQGMRRDAIYRFALGMDLPPEMVLGMGSNEGTGGGNSNGVSHWGAWMIEEQAIKMHVEPMLDLLVASLTTYYLRPLVSGTDRVRYDTSALRLRPDRSAESLELYDRGLVGPLVVVRENGFGDDDVMTPEERVVWLTVKAATGSNTPEQVDAAMRELGVDLDVRYPEAEAPVEPDIREAPSTPSLEDHPDRPRTPEYSVFEALMLRGLERAGARLRNVAQQKTPGAARDAHVHISANGSTEKILEDVWGLVDEVIPEGQRLRVTGALDGYARHIIAAGEPYCRESFHEWCKGAGL